MVNNDLGKIVSALNEFAYDNPDAEIVFETSRGALHAKLSECTIRDGWYMTLVIKAE